MKETHCDYEYLAAGGALYALEPDEDAALAAHLPQCIRCRELLLSSREAATYLSAGVPQEDPPPELRSRILELAANTPQVTPGEREDSSSSFVDGSRPPEVSSLAEARERRPGGRTRARMLVAAALVVFLGVTGVLGVRVAQLSDERDAQVAESSRVSEMLRSVSDPDATRTVLNAGDERAATLVASERGAVLMPNSLRPNDGEHVYVVWGTDGSRPTALSTFDVAGNGGDPVALRWSPESSRHTTYAVSLERGRTAPATPTQVLASGVAQA